MKTIVYIDGYNFYYGCLKQSKYKWLDIFKLCEDILHVQNPEYELVKVRFFTAPVKSNFSKRAGQSQSAQAIYHQALMHLYADKVQITEGYFQPVIINAIEGVKPPVLTSLIKVWKLEEKQTDVNIAVSAIEDALHNRCEQAVFFSNDSDLGPALAMLERNFPNIQRAAIFPVLSSTPRSGSAELQKYVTWSRKHIREEELEAHQLPDKISRAPSKPAKKPEHW